MYTKNGIKFYLLMRFCPEQRITKLWRLLNFLRQYCLNGKLNNNWEDSIKFLNCKKWVQYKKYV